MCLMLCIIIMAGFFAPCSHPRLSNRLTLLSESLPSENGELPSSTNSNHTNRNRCPVPGTLYNLNTMEGFNDLDEQKLMKEEAEKVHLHNHISYLLYMNLINLIC